MSGNGRLLTDFHRLTKRQQEIVGLVRLGLSNKQIARELGISASTVKVHLSNIFLRLEVRDRRQIMLRFQPPPPVGYARWPTQDLVD